MSSNSESGDWHETLVDLLAAGCGIPEDRARSELLAALNGPKATPDA
ncbi:hypothetical protein [Streptomyces tubercidicus]